MINIETELTRDFLTYAKEVNQNRSFPDVLDGLKPSQRAALYTLFSKGYTSSKPHVKCAKVVGAVIGDLWPHGDVGAYDTVVRMSQPWVNNIPYVDFHGANGSLLGGPEAASSRYTECRLSKVAEDGLFENIKNNTVDFIPNFSEDMEWPKVLPSLIPTLFVNGSQGIGYTIAQEWEPGNLKEITEKVKEYIKSGKLNYSDIYPDYPTGGIIVNKKDIHSIYETGKGTVVLRGKVTVSGNIISITELPYQVYAEDLISKIKELANDGSLPDVNDIYNKSDDNGMLIEVVCEKDAENTLKRLYKLTDLQCSYNTNQMALVNGEPKLLNLEEYIKEYINHNLNCITRECEFELDKAQKRLNVVAGLLVAHDKIDEIIKCIKASNSTQDAKDKLEKEFGFNYAQAAAIVDMRLSKLAHIENQELTKEQDDLNKSIEKYSAIISTDKNKKTEFIKRLNEFVKKYGADRKTEVIDADLTAERETRQKAEKQIEECFVVLTSDGKLKRITPAEYKPNKSIDIIAKSVKMAVSDKVILVSNSGMMYKLPVNKIAKCTMNSVGMTPPFEDIIIDIFTGSEEQEFIFMVMSSGRVKKIVAKTVFEVSKTKGAPIATLDNEKILNYYLVNDDVISVRRDNTEINIDTIKYRAKGRTAGGVACIKLKPGQTLYT